MTPPPASILSEPLLTATELGVHALPGRRISRDLGQLIRFVRFAIVGGLASIVYLGLFATMVAMGMHYLVAGTIGYLAAIATNFAVNREWTFGRGMRALHVQAISFLGVQLIIGAVNLTPAARARRLAASEPIILAQLHRLRRALPDELRRQPALGLPLDPPPGVSPGRAGGGQREGTHRPQGPLSLVGDSLRVARPALSARGASSRFDACP